MNWKTTFIIIILTSIFINIVGFIQPQEVSAQIYPTLTLVYDEMERINEGSTSGHTVYLVSPNGVVAGGKLEYGFDVYFIFGGSYNYTDMAFAVGSTSNCATASFSSKTLAAAPSGATWGATYSSNLITITSGTDTIPASRCIRATFNSNGAGHTITNTVLGANGSMISYAAIYDASNNIQNRSTYAQVSVYDPSTPDGDQIQIDAQVENALAFDVDIAVTNCNNSTETTSSQNRINLGTLTPGTVKKSNGTIQFICLDFTTNGANGGSIAVRSARVAAAGGLVRVGTSTAIVSATADLNNGGVLDGYGIRVADTGTPSSGSFTISSPYNSATSGSVGLIPGTSASAASVVTASAAVQTGTSDRIEVELAAKAGVNNAAGIYTDTLTFTATANF